MNILLALDGSQVSAAALPFAVDMAQRFGATLILLRCTRHFGNMAPSLPFELGLEVQQDAHQEAIEYLAEVESRLRDCGCPCECLTPLGPARDLISQVAQQQGCEFVIMTSTTREGPARWLLGSVAESVLRQCSSPVFTLKSSGGFASSRFHHILVPVDGSELSLSVLGKVAPFLAPGGKVTMLQTAELVLPARGETREKFLADYLDSIEKSLQDIRLDEFPTQVVVLEGEPAEAILAWSQQNECDLIAMSTHGHSGFRKFWLGSVTEKVARHSPCPVLTFPGV